MALSEKYHWTPEQIGDLTLPQAAFYLRSDEIMDALKDGKTPNRVYFTGTPAEQMAQMKKHKEQVAEDRDKLRPWRLA